MGAHRRPIPAYAGQWKVFGQTVALVGGYPRASGAVEVKLMRSHPSNGLSPRARGSG